ncbi:HIT domain-containing protein [Candidatus Dependentiae bacterium]|nr:HIT domain-containing protein [Candidatus Dependentiae bacterium]
MNDSNCIFCKIILNQVPTQKIIETNDLIVIKDINPQAPIHYLIIPKTHISNLQTTKKDDQLLLGAMLLVTKELSKNLKQPQDFRIISNNGALVGQSVFHLHFHFLAGKSFTE